MNAIFVQTLELNLCVTDFHGDDGYSGDGGHCEPLHAVNYRRLRYFHVWLDRRIPKHSAGYQTSGRCVAQSSVLACDGDHVWSEYGARVSGRRTAEGTV